MAQLSMTERLFERVSAEEQLVWDLLQDHVGKQQAITNARLAEATGLDERLVRWCIKQLTEDHRKEIGSLPGLGVFVIATRDERDEVLSFYLSHSLSLLKRMAILKRTTARGICNQLLLALEQSMEERT